MKLGTEWLNISSRKDLDFDATRDERLDDGGAVDILYPHICIVSAYRVPPTLPCEGPLGFVPGFFTRGVAFLFRRTEQQEAVGLYEVEWEILVNQPTNQPIRPTSSQVRVTSPLFDQLQLKATNTHSGRPLSRSKQS